MPSAAFADCFTSAINELSSGSHILVGYILNMAAVFSGLLSQTRTSRSESNPTSSILSAKELDVVGDSQLYPGSLHRYQRSYPGIPQYRSMRQRQMASPCLRRCHKA